MKKMEEYTYHAVSGVKEGARGMTVLEASAAYLKTKDYELWKETAMDMQPRGKTPSLAVVPGPEGVRVSKITPQPLTGRESRPHGLQEVCLLNREEMAGIVHELDGKAQSSSFWRNLTAQEKWSLFLGMAELMGENTPTAICCGAVPAQEVQADIYRILPLSWGMAFSSLSNANCPGASFAFLFLSEEAQGVRTAYYKVRTLESLLKEEAEEAYPCLRSLILEEDERRYEYFEFLQVVSGEKPAALEELEEAAMLFLKKKGTLTREQIVQARRQKKRREQEEDQLVLELRVSRLGRKLLKSLEEASLCQLELPLLRQKLMHLYEQCKRESDIAYVKAQLRESLFTFEYRRAAGKFFVQALMMVYEMTDSEYLAYKNQNPFDICPGPYDYAELAKAIHRYASTRREERALLNHVAELQMDVLVLSSGTSKRERYRQKIVKKITEGAKNYEN